MYVIVDVSNYCKCVCVDNNKDVVMEKSYKILVIDDSPFVFKSVKKALEPYGFLVEDNAINGKIGQEVYEKSRPDVVILDITMPVMDGLETAKALFTKNPGIKIVMLSARRDEVLISQAKNLGIKQFVQKPFKNEELHSAVKNILGN